MKKINKQYILGFLANFLLLMGFVLSFFEDGHDTIWLVGKIIIIISVLLALVLYGRMILGHLGNNSDE